METLLAAAQAGDAAAFEEIYRACSTRLLRKAMLLCGNADVAEELAEDTLVEAWKCLRRYNGRCEFFTWLCAILLNRHRNHLRKDRRFRIAALRSSAEDEFADAVEQLADSASLPNESAEVRDQAALVRRCIAALSTKHRQVIFLRFYVDDSLEGIAAALGCSIGTVKSRLFHALERLRAMHALTSEFPNLNPRVDL